MHAERLMDVMAETMSIHGYTCTRKAALEGRSGTVYTVPLLAEGHERAIVMDVQLGLSVTQEAVSQIADVMHDVGADQAVLCHDGPAAGLTCDGVALWGQELMIQLIGEARLCEALENAPETLRFESLTSPKEVLAESVSELLPDAFLEVPDSDAFEEPSGLADLLGGALDLDALGNVASAAPHAPVATSEHAPSTPRVLPSAFSATAGDAHANGVAAPGPMTPVVPLAFPPAGETPSQPRAPPHAAHPMVPPPVDPASMYAFPLLPIRVTPDEARMSIRAHMETVHQVLFVAQPVHLFDYECDLLAEGSLRYDTISGRVQVHGTDKTVTEIDAEAVDPQGFTRLGELPKLPGHERTLRVSDERARSEASHHLLESHTRIVEVEVDDPDLGYAYTEKKKVAPRPDHIRLNPVGTFHRVIWRFVGPAGQMDVDALTGEVVAAALQRPDSDAMIIE